MGYEHLNDLSFLDKLDKMRLRTIYARINILDFNTEETIEYFEGRVTGGNISVSSTSRIRRSLNLQMITRPDYQYIKNLDYLISINRKIKVEIGLANPFATYEPIVWFPQGIFVISSAVTTRNTTGWNVSITAKDKMVLLNGICGGTLSGVTRFDRKYIENEDGSITAQEVPIYQIVLEAVNHWGNEPLDNIIINDIPEYGQWIIKYTGMDDIYFASDYSTVTNSKLEAESWETSSHVKLGYITKKTGEEVGYQETPFVYPGELILKPGDTVVTLLDKIVEQLENFEYFYDINGHFVFQQIKNYTNTASPWWEIDAENYIETYSNTKYQYTLTDQQNTTSITKTPNYDNIKNDFIVWGQRTTSSGTEVDICYRLVVDEKPELIMAAGWFWEILKDDELFGYTYTTSSLPPEDPGFTYNLIGKPCAEWREEIFRQATAANFYGTTYSAYDADLLKYWRDIFDTMKEAWEETGGWNPAIYTDPSSIVYWLDFIDGYPTISKYSVRSIGRRTKVENNNKVKSLFYKEIPDIIFLTDPDEETLERYRISGQQYFITNDKYDALFRHGAVGVSAFDCIRSMLYKHLTYNTTIQVSCIPKYYLECNSIIYVNDAEMSINGNYCINSFSVPLTYNGTMNISMSEVLTRV